MLFESAIKEIDQKKFYPIYCVCGDEIYFVEEYIKYVEQNILTEKQKQFDMSVFYGKTASFEAVYNACAKAPMLSTFNVVILKDAQLFTDLKRFEKYIQNPLQQTLLFWVFRDKALDAKTKFGALLKAKTNFIDFIALKDSATSAWVKSFLLTQGFTIQEKALQLLIEHVGNDLVIITNELKKICINHLKEKEISLDEIAENVGVSKEFNIFELQKAIGKKDRNKMIQIMKHFIQNPKSGAFIYINIVLYKYFSKLLMVAENAKFNERDLANMLGLQPYHVGEYIEASKNYSVQEIEKNILVLGAYNLKALGIDTDTMHDRDLKKELLTKLMLV